MGAAVGAGAEVKRESRSHVVMSTAGTVKLLRPMARWEWHGFESAGCSTSGGVKRRTKRSLVKNELGDRVNAARLEYTRGTLLGETTTTRGRVPVKSARS